MAQRKKALGKGLGALLAAREEGQSSDQGSVSTSGSGSIALIAIEAIVANRLQPRTEFETEALEDLSESIRQFGIIQPLTVRKTGPSAYELISGERRFRASQMAGLTEVPAYVRDADDQAMLEMALIENIHREDLNAMEIALSYQKLMDDFQFTQEQLSSRVAKKRSTITNYLRLLKLPVEIQSGIIEGLISMGHARALVNAGSEDRQVALYRMVLNKGLSVRQVEALVKSPESKPAPVSKVRKVSLKPGAWAGDFRPKMEAKVEEEGKGAITIRFESMEEYERLVQHLSQ